MFLVSMGDGNGNGNRDGDGDGDGKRWASQNDMKFFKVSYQDMESVKNLWDAVLKSLAKQSQSSHQVTAWHSPFGMGMGMEMEMGIVMVVVMVGIGGFLVNVLFTPPLLLVDNVPIIALADADGTHDAITISITMFLICITIAIAFKNFVIHVE